MTAFSLSAKLTAVAGNAQRIFLAAVSCGIWLGMFAGAAQAEIATLSQSGAWRAFGGMANDGVSVCGLISGGPERQFTVKWFLGRDDLIIQIFKGSWSIPAKMQIDVSIQFGQAVPWTGKGTGFGGTGIELRVPTAKLDMFLNEFRFSNTITVSFPTGTESQWNGSMAGSNTTAVAMLQCVSRTTAASASAPSQPYTQAPQRPSIPSQPFTTPPAVVEPARSPQSSYRAI
jgi:hypothetical protein